MYEGLSLLADVRQATADWILSKAADKTVRANATVVQEGGDSTELMIVIDGLFAVRLGGQQGADIAMLGPGELIGEISFLERAPASATVVAVEDSRVLSLARADLEQHASENAEFGVDFYRALG